MILILLVSTIVAVGASYCKSKEDANQCRLKCCTVLGQCALKDEECYIYSHQQLCDDITCKNCCFMDARGNPYCGDVLSCYQFLVVFLLYFLAFTIFIFTNIVRRLHEVRQRISTVAINGDTGEKEDLEDTVKGAMKRHAPQQLNVV